MKTNINRKYIPIVWTFSFIALLIFLYAAWYHSLNNKAYEGSFQSKIESEALKAYGHEIIHPKAENRNVERHSVHVLTPKTDQFIWVNNATGGFMQRIKVYNQWINNTRNSILERRHFQEWKDIENNSSNRNVLWCNRDDFMTILQTFPEVQSILLPWAANANDKVLNTKTENKNVLVQTFYEWSATEPLCDWIKMPGYTKARWDAVHNRTCNTNTTLAFVPKSLEPVCFYGKPINPRDYWPNEGFSYPSYFYTDFPGHVFYMHILQDALITGVGDVFSGSLKLVPYTCSQDVSPEPPPRYQTETRIYTEVFVITQFWGNAFYHKMNEVLPRIAPYWDFLQSNPSIKVHVAEEHGYTRELLRFLGLAPERLISETTRAKIVYLPQATPCGFAQAQGIQVLSRMLNTKIEELLLPEERNLIVMIHRSGNRRFERSSDIEGTVEKLAVKFGLEYLMFSDHPTPPMAIAMRMFYQARIIVAPHGAGLSNMIYSQPGTLIIEGVCNPPHVNLCYQWSAHVLGHRYHGIPSRRGCEDYIDIDPTVVQIVLTDYLQQMKERGEI